MILEITRRSSPLTSAFLKKMSSAFGASAVSGMMPPPDLTFTILLFYLMFLKDFEYFRMCSDGFGSVQTCSNASKSIFKAFG